MFFPRSWCPSTKTSPVTRKWNSNLKLCWKSVGSRSLELDLNCLSCSRELPTCCSWRMIIHWISLCRWLISWPLCGVRLPSPPLPLINGTDARYSAVQTCEFVGDVLCVTKLQTVALAIINRRKAPRWEMKAVRIAADRGGRFFWKICFWCIFYAPSLSALKLGDRCQFDQSCKYFDKNTICGPVNDHESECQCRVRFYPSAMLESITRTNICIPGECFMLWKSSSPRPLDASTEDAPATANKCIFRYKRHVIHRRRVDALLTKTHGEYDQSWLMKTRLSSLFWRWRFHCAVFKASNLSIEKGMLRATGWLVKRKAGGGRIDHTTSTRTVPPTTRTRDGDVRSSRAFKAIIQWRLKVARTATKNTPSRRSYLSLMVSFIQLKVCGWNDGPFQRMAASVKYVALQTKRV